MAKLSDILSRDNNEKLREFQKKNAPVKKTSKKQSKPSRKKNPAPRVRIPDFVSIDLETTGLDKGRDRITEIGMVKYIGGKEVDSYSSLVNPGIPIPQEIVQLTGITDKMVAAAPRFPEIMDEVYTFIGRLALCAHKVDFDFYFLNAAFQRHGGKRIRNWRIDTLATARLLLDLHEGYALGKVAKALDINLQNAHRALDDARAGGEVALKLIPMIDDIPPHTRVKLARFAPFSFVKKILESSVQGYEETPSTAAFKKKSIPPKAPGDPAAVISPTEISELFSSRGAVQKHFADYYERAEQVAFARETAKTLNSRGVAAMEAGTGTGKSLAYVLPAAKWALATGKTAVISTNTKNLQEQLTAKELPLMREILGESFRFSLLKGKNNYVCIKAWKSFVSGETGSLSPHERDTVLPLIKWIDETKTGDIEEQNFFNHHRLLHIWQLISAENRNCSGCAFFSRCFMQYARRKAAHSHVVVINHALFYSDILGQTNFVEHAGALIFDEAHQLVPTGYRALECEIDTRRARALIEFMQETLNTLKGYKKDIPDPVFERMVHQMTRAVKSLRKNTDQFFGELTLWLNKNAKKADDVNRGILLIRYEKNEFSVYSGLSGMNIALTECIEVLESFKRSGITGLENTIAMNEVRVGIDRARQFRADLSYLTAADVAGHVFWAQGPKTGQWAKLTGTPVAANTFLTAFWKQFRGGLVFTSATLSPDDDLHYFCARAGLSDLSPKTKKFESHFSRESVLPLAVKNGPAATDAQYGEYIISILRDIKQSINKNTLVLFTNNTLLEEVYHTFMERYPEYKGEIFAQRISGNRSWIQNQMQEVQGAVLLGSGAFWEGVDIPGEACEIVVIPRLPFPVPSHPVVRAISEDIDSSGGNGFMDYYVQEAVLRFKQGMGRLIRHRDDRGILCVLDSRMVQKGYGKRFLRVSPVEFEKVDSDMVSSRVRGFLQERE